MVNTTIGIIAHVDAGKTTLSEAMLYLSGTVRTLGRVDKGDAFLDTFRLERQRGITIFSKQARLKLGERDVTLLDTPGHVDFSGEMERTLSVLDYAVLVVSAADGVQPHTLTAWRLLERYGVPTFIFVNKMDREVYLGGAADSSMDHSRVRRCFINNLSENLTGHFVDFSERDSEDFAENVALSDEEVMDAFLEGAEPDEETISMLVAERKLTPVFFGSALKLEGVETFMDTMGSLMCDKLYSDDFGALVYKVSRDSDGNRLTHMKITGGTLKVRDSVDIPGEDGEVTPCKVNHIRFYSGEKYGTGDSAAAGDICAVTGLIGTRPGMGLGSYEGGSTPFLEPVLTYRVILPKDITATQGMEYFKELEEEDPLLNVFWNQELKELSVRVMGDIQVEVLKEVVKERFGIDVEFGNGNIVYKETIANAAYGVGHFEPLRHYAEVHLLLEPGVRGSGLIFENRCSTDLLAGNWQRLIMTHLRERKHRGVLTGSAVTDMKITLLAGKAHLKHTEGGDFRQATYRAVRAGLMEAESLLLEPFYEFELTLPAGSLGRAMTDIDGMKGEIEPPQTLGDVAILKGRAPVSLMMDYQKEVAAYTGGEGHVELKLYGYLPCHNSSEVIENKGYDPEGDMRNPCGSVFCEGGAGTYVPWNEVKDRCDLPLAVGSRPVGSERTFNDERRESAGDIWIDTEEVDRLVSSAGGANKKPVFVPHKGINKGNREKKSAPVGLSKPAKTVKKEKYLLVDGYNVIYAWEDLKDLADDNIDGARGALADVLVNYRSLAGVNLILVFDAYRVSGHQTEAHDYQGIQIVYTKEAETADMYIEKFAHKNARDYDITVVTSDGLEQIIIRGAGCGLISAREFKEEVERAKERMREMIDN